VAAVTGGFGGAFWNDVATTGPRYLIWPACALSVVAVGSLYLCFAVLGGWWPIRLVPGAAAFAAPTLIAGKPLEAVPALRSPEGTGIGSPSWLASDPALAAHWDPRSRGVERASRRGWFFTGRRRALSELVEWLCLPTGRVDALRVVTGGPGSGKSAVLARLVTLSDATYRSALPEPLPEDDPIAGLPVGTISTAVHARKASTLAVLTALAAGIAPIRQAADAEDLEMAVGGLIDSLLASTEPVRIVVDALDEAQDPASLAVALHRLTAEAGDTGLRLLVGTRPGGPSRRWLTGLGLTGRDDPALIDLDLSGYLERADLVEYVRRRLLQPDLAPLPGRTHTPYRGQDELAGRVAAAVTEAAYPTFLIAQMVTRALLNRTDPITPSDPGWQRFPDTVELALDDYLRSLGDQQEQSRMEDLLRPLAFARGDGLPHDRVGLWPALASALARPGQSYTLADVDGLLDTAADYLIETVVASEAEYYRLYHQALASRLISRDRRQARATPVEGIIVNSLLATLPQGPTGTRLWNVSHPYLRHHLAGHAAAAGRLLDLLDDEGFIETVNASSLFTALQKLRPTRGDISAQIYRDLRIRFGRMGSLPDLDASVDASREAVAATSNDQPDRGDYLATLATALQTRFERTGNQADLDEAIKIGRDAVAACPADHPARAGYLPMLGTALRLRFERTGALADLDEAIDAARYAVEATPADHPARAGYLSNLATALRLRFERTGELANLDQAIRAGRDAVAVAPVDEPDLARYLSTLATALQTRFERTGDQADGDEAIKIGRDAVAVAPVDEPDLARYLSTLATALQTRFGRSGDQADLDEAIKIGLDAVAVAPIDHPDRAGYLSNLGTALRLRFERAGELADLDQAIEAGGEAVAVAPGDHPARAGYLSTLAAALRLRFGRAGELADLDQAIDAARYAVDATPADRPARADYLFNLATALRTRFEARGVLDDLNTAIIAYREAVAVAAASPRVRVLAASSWGQCALQAGNSSSAVEGYAAAIELLPLVAWHGLDQATREHVLREWAGLASDAAAAAVVAGRAARAVELLEAGRSMLWTQALHLRQDLADLQERAPDLAAVLEASRAVLDAPSTSMIHDLDTVGDVDQVQAAKQQALEKRRQAARDWDAAVDQVRWIEGFEHFLRPFPFTDLRAAATDGPVVIVNISRHGSHALIVTPATRPHPDPSVLVVDLPDAPMSIVLDQASTLLSALDRAGNPTTGGLMREAGRHAVFDVLAWSWQSIAEPVLSALGHTDAPRERIEDWPRVWWCPTGPATVLPLHAAGRYPRTTTQYAAMGEAAAFAETVAGRVISSYTPTLTTLIRARIRPAPSRVRQLAVGMPEAPSYAPGAGPLPAVRDELKLLASYLPPPEHATHLFGHTATRQAVLKALPGHSWLHLSCASVQDPADASLSAFLLDDQPLTLADLAALNLRETDLAYLSASQTATGDIRLLDEALHLAGALQLAGYRHVLATMWSIFDAAAPAMADVIYAHLLHPDPGHPNPTDRPQAARAPYALHDAVTRLRQAYPGEPLLWAPYIHLGP
jgi:hypothetical protein